MNDSFKSIKDQLRNDAAARKSFFAHEFEGEVSASVSDLPAGTRMNVLSPGHNPEAVYLSPGFVLGPRTSLEIEGTFECVSEDRVYELPVLCVEECSDYGVGKAVSPTFEYREILLNEGVKPRRLALRLAPVAELPKLFLLFCPKVKVNGYEFEPPPLLFGEVRPGCLCIRDIKA